MVEIREEVHKRKDAAHTYGIRNSDSEIRLISDFSKREKKKKRRGETCWSIKHRVGRQSSYSIYINKLYFQNLQTKNLVLSIQNSPHCLTTSKMRDETCPRCGNMFLKWVGERVSQSNWSSFLIVYYFNFWDDVGEEFGMGVDLSTWIQSAFIPH